MDSGVKNCYDARQIRAEKFNSLATQFNFRQNQNKIKSKKNVAGPVQLTNNDRRKQAAFPTIRKRLKNEESAPTGAAC